MELDQSIVLARMQGDPVWGSLTSPLSLSVSLITASPLSQSALHYLRVYD